jgi:xylose isomerase
MIEKAAEVKDLVYLDINVPFASSEKNAIEIKKMLDDNNLKCRATTPHIYMREYIKGALTNPDKKLRQKAKDRVKEAISAAEILGAHYVKFWPGQDGFDMPGQANYLQLWEYSIQGIKEIAEEYPNQQFAIEYKPKEPRVKMTLTSATKTLLAISEMNVNNVGIVMDFGHSLNAGETPAESLLLVHRHGKLVSAELNDNWREWDDDLPVASIHLFETLEYMLALRQINWTDPILLDQFPFREDPVKAVSRSIETIKFLEEVCDRIDTSALTQAQNEQDALAAQAIYWNALIDSKRF